MVFGLRMQAFSSIALILQAHCPPGPLFVAIAPCGILGQTNGCSNRSKPKSAMNGDLIKGAEACERGSFAIFTIPSIELLDARFVSLISNCTIDQGLLQPWCLSRSAGQLVCPSNPPPGTQKRRVSCEMEEPLGAPSCPLVDQMLCWLLCSVRHTT